MKVEATVMVRQTNEGAYLATVYDGNPEPKNFKEAQNSLDLSNWWEGICVEFRNMEHKQVWEITPNTSVPTGRKVIGSRWVLARKMTDVIGQDATQRVLVKYQEKTFKKNMHQLFLILHYTY
jgi:hypothetical protein